MATRRGPGRRDAAQHRQSRQDAARIADERVCVPGLDATGVLEGKAIGEIEAVEISPGEAPAPDDAAEHIVGQDLAASWRAFAEAECLPDPIEARRLPAEG